MSFPSGSQDIDLTFDPKSIIEGFRKIDRARQDMEKGVTGATEKWNTAFTSFSEKIIKVSGRAQQAQERYVKSIEQTAAAYGKSGAEKLIAQRDAIIKRLGEEEKLVNRVKTAYDKMIEAEKKRGGGGHLGGSSSVTMLRGARDLFEGRTAYGEVMMARGLSSLSGLPLLLGSTAAAFGVVALAGYKAAESVGKYAQEIHDLSITTGLSSREVQQFQFAAKVTGQDISVLDRMTRGLTQAIEDEGSQGQKARKVLQGMGVDILSLRSGAIGSGELFSQISAALESQPNLWVRNREAIELFKRAGITSLPMLMELNQSLRETSGIHFMSEEQLNSARQSRKEIELFKTEFDQLLLSLKRGLAQPFIIAFKFFREKTSDDIEFDANGRPIVEPYTAGAYKYRGAHAPLNDLQRERDAQIGRAGRPPLEMASRRDYLYSLKQGDAEAAENEAGRLKKIYDQTREDVTKTKDEIVAARVEYEKQHAVAKALSQSESDRLSAARALVELQKTAAERSQYPYGMLPSQRALLGFSKLPGATPSQIEGARSALLPERMNEIREMLQRVGLKMNTDGSISRDMLQLKDANGKADELPFVSMAPLHKEMERKMRESDENGKEFVRHAESALNASAQGAQSTAIFRAQSALLMSPDTLSNRLAAERQIAAAKIQYANDTYDRERAKIADEYNDLTTRETAYQALRLKHANEIGDIQQEVAEKQLTEMRKQFDEIKSTTESLLHTLFTNPKSFGKQLGTTLRDAALRPVESGISTMISRSLYTTVFGANGTGGINGALSSITPVNGAIPVFIVGAGSSASNGGGVMSSGSGSGGGGIPSLPGFSGLSADINAVTAMGGLMTDTSGMFMSGAPGGTSGFSGPVGLGPTSGGGGGGLFSGGGGGGGGIGGMIGKVFGLFGGGKGKGGYGSILGGESVPSGGFLGKLGLQRNVKTGKISGVGGLGGMALLAGGGYLAQRGLLGPDRGTWGGAVEGGIGGAAIGMKFGGPLGALIGGVVGFGIGVGEKLAGVESPRNHAKKLVQQMYGVGINNSVADQIVALAQQSYGGQVSVAVRSPEVRQMLGLYAAGTGQRMPQSATTPHGASLSSIGGSLFQNPVYQYGNPYTYQSSLPVTGGLSAGSFPSPGGGATFVSLNVGGDSVGSFMTGRYVTPDLVQSQYSAAMQSSKGRLDTALMFANPGTIVA